MLARGGCMPFLVNNFYKLMRQKKKNETFLDQQENILVVDNRMVFNNINNLFLKQIYWRNVTYRWPPRFTSFAVCVEYYLGAVIFHKMQSFWWEQIWSLVSNDKPWIYHINTSFSDFFLCIKCMFARVTNNFLINLTVEFPVCLSYYKINTKKLFIKKEKNARITVPFTSMFQTT